MTSERGQCPGLVNPEGSTYIDVGYPAQGTDHVRFRDAVTGVQGQDRDKDDEKEEYAIVKT